jgi:hypothetical protein
MEHYKGKCNNGWWGTLLRPGTDIVRLGGILSDRQQRALEGRDPLTRNERLAAEHERQHKHLTTSGGDDEGVGPHSPEPPQPPSEPDADDGQQQNHAGRHLERAA